MLKRERLTRLYIRVDRAGYKINVSLCSVNPIILNVFLTVTKTRKKKLVEWIQLWTEEDFSWKMDYTEYYHIKLLKELVIDKYRKIYPHIYYNNALKKDAMWLRVWISEKMGREIRRYDKPAYNRLFKQQNHYYC